MVATLASLLLRQSPTLLLRCLADIGAFSIDHGETHSVSRRRAEASPWIAEELMRSRSTEPWLGHLSSSPVQRIPSTVA